MEQKMMTDMAEQMMMADMAGGQRTAEAGNGASRRITVQTVSAYRDYLCREEKAARTMEKYMRDVKRFAKWLSGREVTKKEAVQWKEHLRTDGGYAPRSINSMVSAVNGLFSFLGWGDCRMKFLKIQQQIFREESRDLRQEEYRKLVETAYAQDKKRLGLILETICGTGIRVSELEFITVGAVKKGRVEIMLKGKVRVILMPAHLRGKLLEYVKNEKIVSGKLFLTRNGKSVSRHQIWTEMKKLCMAAGVEPSKVFPHNLRHLFAKSYYNVYKDIVGLANMLGHSSIDTTRLYLLTTGAEHMRQLDQLELVS